MLATHHPELPLGLGEDAQKDEDGIPREEGTVVCGKRIPAGEEQFIWGKGLWVQALGLLPWKITMEVPVPKP